MLETGFPLIFNRVSATQKVGFGTPETGGRGVGFSRSGRRF